VYDIFSFSTDEFFNELIEIATILCIQRSFKFKKLFDKLSYKIGLLNLLGSKIVRYFNVVLFL